MDREILFRAVESHKGTWIYGNLLIGKNSEDWASIIPKENADEGQPLYEFEVYPETIGQYTGLKDKNGTKIFEGDIVKGTIVSQWAKEEIICCVEYQTDGFVCIEKGGYKHKIKFAKNIEVIGNIYDNPELLEGL